MLGLEYFGFQALFSPYFFIFMLFIAAAYVAAVGPYRNRFEGAEPVSTSKKILFFTGWFLFYLVQGGPLELLGHLMFSFHMINMAIAYIVVPPLILMGIPAWLWRSIIRRLGNPMTHPLMNPILTAVLFNMLFSFYHIPNIHDVIMTQYLLHTLYYIILLIAAFMMWWNVICPVPELNRLTEVRKMGYIFLNGLLLTPSCALIIFAGAPLFAVYNDPKIWVDAMGYCVPGDPSVLLQKFSDGPMFFNLMSPLEDQQFGGTVMKLLQEFVYGTVLAYVFYHWYKRENNEEDITPNSLDNSGPLKPI